jgi:hypothetical protein
MPPVCLRTSARTKPGGRRFPWPLFGGFSAGVTTSADVLNVAMLNRPGYRSQRAGRAAARHHGQVQLPRVRETRHSPVLRMKHLITAADPLDPATFHLGFGTCEETGKTGSRDPCRPRHCS